MKVRFLSAALAALFLAACPETSNGPVFAPTQAPVAPPPPVDAGAPIAEMHTPTPAEQFLLDCRAHLADSQHILDTIVAAQTRTIASTLEPYNVILIHLGNAGNEAGTLNQVHPDPEFRAAASKCSEEVSSFSTALSLNPALYKAISAVPLDAADADTKRFVMMTLRDFRRAGVDKDEATRRRIKELNDLMTTLGIEFDKDIREDVHKVALDPKELKGLPDDYKKAHAPGPDGKVVVTTDYPDYIPFSTYGEDVGAREKLYREFLSRGYPKNDEVLKKLLAARKELATILGYKSYADYITEDKMIKSDKNARDFIDRITKAADKRAHRDYADLLKRKKKDDPKATVVRDFEKGLYAEKLRREQYAFDSQSVRPYFPFQQTLDGLLSVTSKVFGFEYKKQPDAPRWHPDVDVYDVYQDGKKLGRIYLDLHPRDGKYKHAANFGFKPGVLGVQDTESALVCNFPDPKKGEALLEHDEVVTMFHEFGHLVHSLLGGKQRWVYFSGTATEFDFVEAPSQMFEEWAWDPDVLATFAKHKDTGEPIPKDLVKKMRRAEDFGKGANARQQMFYAAVSLGLHEQADVSSLDLTKFVQDTQSKYALFPYVEGTHFQDSFGHLNDYSAMYYTYMWSLVIAKDLLTEFKKHGLMDAATDKKYREEILARGGSRDAAELVKNFLGRDYDFKAYEAWLNEE